MARTIPWETISDWFAKNEQQIRDVMKFEGFRGAVNEVLRLAPDQPELNAQRLRADTAEAALDNYIKQAVLDTANRQALLAAAEQRIAELLAILKNPTEAMIEAGNNTAEIQMEHDSELGSYAWINNSGEILAAMVGAALNPNPEAESHAN